MRKQIDLASNGISTPLEFNAVGDGSTDDTLKITQWLEHCRDNGYIANGLAAQGYVFLITSVIALTGLDRFELVNFKYHYTGGAAVGSKILTLSGSGQGTAINVNNVARGNTSITLNAAGTVSSGNWVKLASANLWASAAVSGDPNVTLAEWRKATSTATGAGNAFTIEGEVSYDYTTTKTVTVTGLARSIVVRDVFPATDDPASALYGIEIKYAENAYGENVVAENCGAAGVSFSESVNCLSIGCGNRNAYYTGGSLCYGVLFNGTIRSGMSFGTVLEYGRHAVSAGSYTGIQQYIGVFGFSEVAAQEAVVDAHPSVDVFEVFGGSSDVQATASRGIASKARVTKILGTSFKGAYYGAYITNPCILYASEIIIAGCSFETNSVAVNILHQSTQQLTIKCDGSFKSENAEAFNLLVNCLGVPGSIKSINLSGTYDGATKGVYIYNYNSGNPASHPVVKSVVGNGTFIVPSSASKYAFYSRAATVGGIDILHISGITIGGQYGLTMNSPNIVVANLACVDYTAAALYNDESGAVDAATRFRINILTRATPDEDFATAADVTTSLALKANIASPTFTGVPAAPTAANGTNTTQVATTAFVIANGTPWGRSYNTADQSVTSSTTLVDITNLSFAAAASKNYIFRATLFITCGASGGIKLSANGPSAPTKVRVSGDGIIPTSGAAVQVNTITSYGGIMAAASGASLLVAVVDIHGKLENGANAGTFILQFAQSASSVTATTIDKYSFIEYSEVT